MRTISCVFFLVIVVSICSCTTHKFLTGDSDYKKLGIPLTTKEIIIIDQRDTISGSEDISLPFLSYPGQSIVFYPRLKQVHTDILRKTIIENLTPQATDISTITLELREAKKEFSATLSTEKELVEIEILIKVEVNNELIEVVESGMFYRKSMDAKYKKFEKLYQSSLKEVTYKALKKFKESHAGAHL